ncbi:MAG: hypothetical protein R2932_16670 [Caldilineaceae bacterium]
MSGDGAGGLLSVDLLGGLTVQTYPMAHCKRVLVLVHCSICRSLAVVRPEQKRTIGFTTTQPFDEVRVRANPLLVLPLISMSTMDCWHRPVTSDTTPPIPSIKCAGHARWQHSF